jgi:hypothetical protein
MEIWKAPPVTEEYEISTLGDVRSLKYGKIRMLKQRILDHDYRLVRISINGIQKDFLVHRLAAMTFLGLAPESKLEVDHLNDNPADNRLINLKVVTPRENSGRAQSKKRDLPTGVTFYSRRNKFGARIYFEKKVHFLGYYKTAEEASAAYQEALKEII